MCLQGRVPPVTLFFYACPAFRMCSLRRAPAAEMAGTGIFDISSAVPPLRGAAVASHVKYSTVGIYWRCFAATLHQTRLEAVRLCAGRGFRFA